METMGWTDEKIEALAEKVDDGFARAEVEYARTDERFKRVDERFDEVDRRFDGVDRRFDRVEGRHESRLLPGWTRSSTLCSAPLIQIGGGLIGTLVVAVVTLIATH